jgi:hypothetical protein
MGWQPRRSRTETFARFCHKPLIQEGFFPASRSMSMVNTV